MKRILSLLCVATMLVTGISVNMAAYAMIPTIADAEITLDADSYTYTGNAIEPGVTVTLGSETLTRDTHYTVSYANNKNAGTAKVTVTGDGTLYTGSKDKEFKIKPVKLSGSAISYIVDKSATPGKAAQYTLDFNGTPLKEGTDYEATYSGYEKAGHKVGKAEYVGKGNFTGTKTFSFNVYPDTVTGIKTKKRTLTSLTLTWNSLKSEGVDGYRLYFCDENGKKTSYIKSTDTNSATIKGLKAGSYYYIKIRAFVNYGKGKDDYVFSDYSVKYKACTAVEKVAMKTVAKTKDKKKLSVKWGKVACTGYEIQYTADKKFKKGVKTVTVNSYKTTSKKIGIPSNNKVYYARVRAFRKYNNGKSVVRGAWSAKFSTSYGNLYAAYDAHYANNPPRTNNLKIACKAINGTVVAPGETFSFNKTVGRRTEAKGYKPAPIFNGPNEVLPGVGGGVCQVASTMFNTALKANVKIVERHQHSQRVHYGTLCRDAAIYWGSEDFKWYNNTNYPIKIKMWCKDGRIHCEFYTSYDVKPKKVKLVVHQNGKNFKLERIVGGKVNYSCRSYY